MLMDKQPLQNCKEIIEKKLDWGSSEQWQSIDFERLQQKIFDETGVSLSASTLRRIWGRVKYAHLPSTTTLDALAKFAGYEHWRAFIKLTTAKDTAQETAVSLPVTTALRYKPFVRIVFITGIVLVTSLMIRSALKQASANINTADYSFSIRRLVHTIPNSVIFTYNAAASSTDSVYIQQSWDPRRRTLVDKHGREHTSIYYEPGFFQAKLIIGNQVIKELPLLIPTEGWLGTVDNKPVPVYLKPSEFDSAGVLRLPVTTLEQLHIPLQPQAPMVRFYNVGNFDPVAVRNFSFSADVRNEYGKGAAACSMARIILITDDAPVIIPLSIKGCVSELTLVSMQKIISGKKADLSGFGVDFSKWVHVACKTENGKITYFVNEQPVITLPLDPRPMHIVGLSFAFSGTGAVKHIELASNGNPVFRY
jgi:hypothetical protein